MILSDDQISDVRILLQPSPLSTTITTTNITPTTTTPITEGLNQITVTAKKKKKIMLVRKKKNQQTVLENKNKTLLDFDKLKPFRVRLKQCGWGGGQI